MIALIVSFCLLAYFFVPRALFRISDVFVPLKFQRTRTQEITSAFSISLAPLLVAIGLALVMWHLPSSRTLDDYKEVFAGTYSDSNFNNHYAAFWSSIGRVMKWQVSFLLIYYPLVVVETLIFVFLVKRYGEWHKYPAYEWFAQKFLLRRINELHLLFTVFNFPRVPELKVVVDVLTQEDHLYQGDVVEYFSDVDGVLSSLTLQNVLRFDRVGYLRDKATDSKAYWKNVPGSLLYIPSGKILSLNLRYEEISKQTAEAATEELLKSGIPLKVEAPSEAVGIAEVAGHST
jgi:hypothetical protein